MKSCCCAAFDEPLSYNNSVWPEPEYGQERHSSRSFIEYPSINIVSCAVRWVPSLDILWYNTKTHKTQEGLSNEVCDFMITL